MAGQRRVGDINGNWALGFQFFILTYPIFLSSLLAFGTWIVFQVTENKHRITAIEKYLERHESRPHDGAISMAQWQAVNKRLDRFEVKVDRILETQ